MTDKPFLAIDLGASSGRAFLGRFEGTRLAVTQVHRFEHKPVRLGGTVFWDFLFLWGNVLEALTLCASRGAAELASMGIDSWNLDFALVDGAGTLLANPVSYRDRSAEGAGCKIASTVRDLELYEETGIPPLPITGLARLVHMLGGEGAKLLDSARAYLPIPDLVRFFLTGTASIEETIAWGTQLVNIRERNWSRKLIELFGIPKRILPDLVPSGGCASQLSREASEITGLAACPVLPVAEHDTMSAVFVARCIDPEAAILSAGTWSILGTAIDEPLVSKEAMEKGFLNELAYKSIFFGKNLMGFYLLEEFLKCWKAKGIVCDYDGVARLALSAPAGGIRLDPNDPLFYSPSNPEDALEKYCVKTGQKLRGAAPGGGIGAIVRALYEGLAASYARALDELNGLLRTRIKKIVMVGGGVRNDFFCRLVANACGVNVVAGPGEAAVLGNLCIQALAANKFGVRDIPAVLKESTETRVYFPRHA